MHDRSTATRKGPKPRPIAERFWAKVNKTEACWLWTGTVMANGYGTFTVVSATNEKALAHRWAYEHIEGPIPEGLDLDHRCHTRSCVRPDHLQPVSRTLNNQNRGNINRNSTSGVRGVSFDKARGLYAAYAMLNRRKYHAGRYATLADAEAAAIALRNRLMTNNLTDRPAD